MKNVKSPLKPESEVNVCEIMSKHPITVGPDARLIEAAHLMLDNAVTALVVVDRGGQLVGILTENDFLRRTEIKTDKPRSFWFNVIFGTYLSAKEYTRSHGLTVGDVMTRDVITTAEQTSVADIVDLMERRRIKHIPIMREQRLVGMMNVTDLMRAVAKMRHSSRGSVSSDADVRTQILKEIDRQGWTAGAVVDASFRDGVADLWGTICEDEQRDALKALALNVPGVRKVDDHLTWESESEP